MQAREKVSLEKFILIFSVKASLASADSDRNAILLDFFFDN
jgi:hypothetical protein